MEQLFFIAFGLSLLVAAQPGIIGFEALRRGLARGWHAALFVEIGSLVGDATWALIALTGASLIFQSAWLTAGLSFFGSLLLMRFAWEALRAARTPSVSSDLDHASVRAGQNNDFTAGAMLSLSNPQNLTAWMGMSGVIVSLGFLNPQPVHVATFFAGFMSAQVVWCFLFASLVGWGRTVLNPQMARVVNLVAALTQAGFAVMLFVQTIRIIKDLL